MGCNTIECSAAAEDDEGWLLCARVVGVLVMVLVGESGEEMVRWYGGWVVSAGEASQRGSATACKCGNGRLM